MKQRPFRFIPAAVSPIYFNDLLYALSQHNNCDGVSKFEKSMSSYLGVKKSYSFTSFMRSIYSCLLCLKKISKQNEIILPRYCCPSFAHAILAAGLKIKYCDLNPCSLNIDIKSLENIDLRNVLAVICVNFFGLSNPMDEIVEFCKKNDIRLIEDVGYSLGTEYKNKKLGNFGDFSVLNFQEGKGIPIGGGMVSTNNVDMMDNFIENDRVPDKSNISIMFGYKLFSNPYFYSILMNGSEFFGKNTRKQFSMEDTIRNTSEEFDFEFDYNSPLKSISNFQGELGCLVLSKIDNHIVQRQKNARILEEELSYCKHIELIEKDKNVNKIHYIRYPVLVKNGLRDEVISTLLKNGIEASSMYSEHGINISRTEFPGSEKVANEILTLPCHPKMNEDALMLTIDVIKRRVC